MGKHICPSCKDQYHSFLVCPTCLNGSRSPYRIEDSEEYKRENEEKIASCISQIYQDRFIPLLNNAIENLLKKPFNNGEMYRKRMEDLLYIPLRNNPFYFKMGYNLFEEAKKIAKERSEGKLDITVGDGFRLKEWEIYFIVVDERFPTEHIKLTKANLNRVIKWTSSKYNPLKKKEAVEKLYAALKDRAPFSDCFGSNTNTLITGTYTESTGGWGRGYQVEFGNADTDCPILYENRGQRLERRWIIEP